MERTAKYLISRIFDHFRMVKELEEAILKTNNPGKQNSLRKDRMMKIGKIKGDMVKLDRMVNGTIAVVKYKEGEDTYEKQYVNMGSDDIGALFRMQKILYGKDIKILEIRIYHTNDLTRKL